MAADQPVFVDRQAEIELLRQILSTGSEGVVNLHGCAGVGKTALLRRFRTELENTGGEIIGVSGTPYAHVDLRVSRIQTAAIYRVAYGLASDYNFQFKRLKKALALLGVRAVPGSQRIETLSGNIYQKIFGHVLDALGLIPVIGTYFKAAKVSKELSETLGSGLLEPDEWEFLRTEDEELLRRLPEYFVQDLLEQCANVEVVPQVALFFDSHEALWRDGEGGALVDDSWLLEICRRITPHRTLTLIAGRESTTWQAGQPKIKQIQLLGLDRHAAEELVRNSLERQGLPDPSTDLVQSVLTLAEENNTQRYHTQALAFCVDAIKLHFYQSASYPAPVSFDDVVAPEVFERVLSVFLRSLNRQAMVTWVEGLSLTVMFDREFATSLDLELNLQNGETGWNRLTELSILEAVGRDFWQINPMFKRVLRSRMNLREKECERVHKWAEGYWSRRGAERDDWRIRGFGWYHLWCLGAGDALTFLSEMQEDLIKQQEFATLAAIREWWNFVKIPSEPTSDTEAETLIAFGDSLAGSANRGISV